MFRSENLGLCCNLELRLPPPNQLYVARHVEGAGRCDEAIYIS